MSVQLAIVPAVNFLDPRVPRRVWDKLQPCPMSGCWTWTGCTMPAGHGQLTIVVERAKRRVLAHRFVWGLARGPVADGLELDHLCRNAACCNPAHLEAVTHRVNVRRGDGWAGRHARAVACPHGHAYDEKNTYVDKAGRRKCRRCNSLRVAKIKREARAARRALTEHGERLG
jgi:hypothetical protein